MEGGLGCCYYIDFWTFFLSKLLTRDKESIQTLPVWFLVLINILQTRGTIRTIFSGCLHIFGTAEPKIWNTQSFGKDGRESWSSGFGRHILWSRGYRFESKYRILEGHLFTLTCSKNCVVCLFEMTKNERKSGRRGWPK